MGHYTQGSSVSTRQLSSLTILETHITLLIADRLDDASDDGDHAGLPRPRPQGRALHRDGGVHGHPHGSHAPG